VVRSWDTRNHRDSSQAWYRVLMGTFGVYRQNLSRMRRAYHLWGEIGVLGYITGWGGTIDAFINP
jgi:hypothetical protein